MPTFRTQAPSLQCLLLAAPIWLANSAVLWAQAAEEAAEDAGKSYALGYALVIMGVGLGLMLVLRPSGRTTEIKLPKSD